MNYLQSEGLNTEEYFAEEISEDQLIILLERIIEEGELVSTTSTYYLEQLNEYLSKNVECDFTLFIQYSDEVSKQVLQDNFEGDITQKSLEWIARYAEDVLRNDAEMYF